VIHVSRLKVTSFHIYPISTSVSTSPLQLIFSDVWGTAPTSVRRHDCYVSFLDDYSKFTWIYLLKKKSDAFSAFVNFQKLVEHKLNTKILTVQSNWSGEYEKLNSLFRSQVSRIMFHVLILTNKMALLSGSIAI
jgi:hypothetical protein